MPDDGQGARKLKSYMLAGGAIEMKPRTSGRRISSCMPIHAPKEKPAIQVCVASGWIDCTQSSAEAASDSSPMPLSNSPWLLPTPRKLKRSVAKPRRTKVWYRLWTMRLFIVPPACGCGWRISATGARGRGPGLKRPSRRPSGPGKMTSGIAPAAEGEGRTMKTAGFGRTIGALYRKPGPPRNHRARGRQELSHADAVPRLSRSCRDDAAAARAARAAMLEAYARWANPSSPHGEGRAARAALEDARRRIAAADRLARRDPVHQRRQRGDRDGDARTPRRGGESSRRSSMTRCAA